MRLVRYTVCLAGLAGPALGAAVDRAACTKSLVIDNFASWTNKTNSLGSVSGDDKSMATIAVAGGALTFTPKAGGYIYENLTPCENAVADGYGSVVFSAVSGPAQSSFLVELQTKANCNDTAVKRSYQNVTVPASSSSVTLPLSGFAEANLDVISSLVLSTFNKTGAPFSIGSIQLACK